MMDWVANLLGLDPSFYNESEIGGGIIMGSASEACLTACIAARSRVIRLFPNTKAEDLVIYGTTQTHSVGAKAALILGLEFRAIETKAEDLWGLRGATLEVALEEGKKEGKVPFILCESRACQILERCTDGRCSGDDWIDVDWCYRLHC
jgi:aromatic-L-amino-acid decarboxylase